MKSEEKSTNKEKQTLIIRKYHQYLKLEKALSPNTVDAYQTDLQKLHLTDAIDLSLCPFIADVA